MEYVRSVHQKGMRTDRGLSQYGERQVETEIDSQMEYNRVSQEDRDIDLDTQGSRDGRVEFAIGDVTGSPTAWSEIERQQDRVRRMMGMTICQLCFLPQVPRPDILGGVPGKTLGRPDTPYMQWKQKFMLMGKELGIEMRKTADRYQEVKLHPKAITGMFTCFHPIEDAVMRYRTGIQTDTVAAARKVMVNRFLMREAYVRALSIDLKIGGGIAKMYNSRVTALQREIYPCKAFGDIYMSPCMASTLYTRMQFYTSPAGSSLRAAFWYAQHNKLALDAFLTKMQRGEGTAIGGAMTESCATSLGKHLLADITDGWKVIKNCIDENLVKIRYMQNLRGGGAGEKTIKSPREIRIMDFEEARRGSKEVNRQGNPKYDTPINVALQTYFLRKYEGGFVHVDPENIGRGPHKYVIEAMFERRNSVYGAPARGFVEKQNYHPAKPVVFRGPAMSETETEAPTAEREERPRRGARREREDDADADEEWGDWGTKGQGSERPAEPEDEPSRETRSRTCGPAREEWGSQSERNGRDTIDDLQEEEDRDQQKGTQKTGLRADRLERTTPDTDIGRNSEATRRKPDTTGTGEVHGKVDPKGRKEMGKATRELRKKRRATGRKPGQRGRGAHLVVNAMRTSTHPTSDIY